MTAHPLYIPVILGTVRKGRLSENAARNNVFGSSVAVVLILAAALLAVSVF